ncbi:MAG: aldehyde dehydrogenase family protein, partial [Mesorhizobium sp.]
MNTFSQVLSDDQGVSDFHTISHGLYIDGQWQQSADGRVIPVIDPSTEAIIAAVPDATLEDAADAVDAAAKAAHGWRTTSPRK